MGVHIADVSHFVRQVRACLTLLVSHAARQGEVHDLPTQLRLLACSAPWLCAWPQSCLRICFSHQLPSFLSQHWCSR